MSAPSVWQIERVMSHAMQTLERLRTEEGQIIETDDELLDALTGENAGVDTVIRRLARAALDAKSNGAAADARIADLRIRRERFKRQEVAYRDVVLAAMEALGLRKFSDPEFSLSVADGRPKPIIVDEAALPDQYWCVTRAPDMAAIRDALPFNVVPGVEMTNAAPVLTIRSK